MNALLQRLQVQATRRADALTTIEHPEARDLVEQELADLRDAIHRLLCTPLIGWRRFVVYLVRPRVLTTAEWVEGQW